MRLNVNFNKLSRIAKGVAEATLFCFYAGSGDGKGFGEWQEVRERYRNHLLEMLNPVVKFRTIRIALTVGLILN